MSSPFQNLGLARPGVVMLRKPLIGLVVLTLIVFGTACDSGGEKAGLLGNTEVNLLISDPSTPPDELAFSVDFVSYRITCPSSGLTPYDDMLDVNGNFEIVDNTNPPVWTLVTSLPLSLCTITLWVFFEDEVVCLGTEMLTILDDGDPSTMNKANVGIECNLSTNPPSGDLDIDGSFTFINGNYCPQLIWLGAIPSVVDPAVPAVTSIQTYSFDVDNTCGERCDPQTCDFSVNPPDCTPGPDPGMIISTLAAPSGVGTIADPNAFDTTYTCDPLLPGPVEICAWVTDGDIECDQHRCITVVCPDLCENVVCDDGDPTNDECTGDRCDPLTGTCSHDLAPDGIACDFCTSTCQLGLCDPNVPFTAAQSGSLMNFMGSMQVINTTLVNPYSGKSLTVSGPVNYNISSYLGVGTPGNDTLVGTNLGDFLLVQDPIGTQRICGVETIFAQNQLDVMFLADAHIRLGDMLIVGGNHPDSIFGNVGNDILQGQNGADILDGGPGNDIIECGAGPDIVTLWHGSGFDSISGGVGIDRVEIDAIQSQIVITPAANPSYEYDVFARGVALAEIRQVEFLVLRPDPSSVLTELVIDLATCVGGAGDVCNLCGNDALNGGEGCDDGNNVDLDGCSATCIAEY